MTALTPCPADMSDADLFALIPDSADWQQVEQRSTPVHTAQRLRANDPVKYETLKRALLCGAALTTLAASHQVGIHTLYAIIEHDLGGRAKYHAGLAEKCKAAANLGVDRVMELLPHEKDVMKAGVVAGIMADKALALSGAPSLVVEHRHHVTEDGVKKLNGMIEELRERLARGKVIEVAESGTEAGSLTEGIEFPDTGGLVVEAPASVPGAVEGRAA